MSIEFSSLQGEMQEGLAKVEVITNSFGYIYSLNSQLVRSLVEVFSINEMPLEDRR